MSEQLDLFTAPPAARKSAAAPAEAFGCCSRFRQCSDAGRCLISEQEYSAGCSYRKNLESGRVFYGKNAVGFVPSEYKAFCDRVDGLSDNARTEYFRILVHFWFSEFSVSSALWDNSPALDLLAKDNLCKLSECSDSFLSLCSDKKLRNILSNHPVYGSLWKEVPAGDKGEKRTKAFLCAWIKRNAAPFLSEYSGRYALLSLNPDSRIYSHEYYYDFLRGNESRYAVALPKDRDDFGLFNAG